MNIALISSDYDDNKLQGVVHDMHGMGAPVIHAVWMECLGHWAALEGCHRLRAAAQLGLTPQIIPVEYSGDPASTVPGYDGDEDYPISDICDDSYQATIIEF